MRAGTTRQFREAFERLPSDVKHRARISFQLWKKSPWHPSLKFKIINTEEQIYSVRIGIGWRALGSRDGDFVSWFWIGSHAEYDRLISSL